MRFLRGDRWGYSATMMAGTIIGIVVTIVIGVALVSTVANQAWLAGQNKSFANKTVGVGGSAVGILPLLVLFFVIGVIVLPVALIFAALKEHDG